MGLSTSPVSLILLTSAWIVHSVSSEKVTATVGGNFTLECNSTDPAEVLQWIRVEPKPLELVFTYRDDRLDTDNQDLSFKNRVVLKDPQIKNGDLSVVLKEVKEEDKGTYECRFVPVQNKRRRRDVLPGPPVRVLELEVVERADEKKREDEPARKEDSGVTLSAGRGHAVLAAAVFLAVVAVGMLFVTRRRQRPLGQDRPAPIEI